MTDPATGTVLSDARDELAADGTNTYSYAANGTLASEVTPAGSFGSDALGLDSSRT